MPGRRDRLSGMMDPGPDPGGATVPAQPAAASQPTTRTLLYAPPPAQAPPYLSILQAEGLDVMLANSVESLRLLLDSAPPKLVIAIVPVLGEDLRSLLREKAPQAEIRVISSLGELLKDWVMSPLEALEFCVRAVSAVAGLLSESLGTPQARVGRAVQLAGEASGSLGMSSADTAAARIGAALHGIPQALNPDDVSATAPTQRMDHGGARLLSSLFDGLDAPVSLGSDPPPGDAAERPPTVLEVVEAAATYAELLEGQPTQPELRLRKRGGPEGLHPAAVEAVIAAAAQREAGNRGRLLLVDGDAADRTMLSLRLANEGYEVEAVSDGRAALEAARAKAPSLIVSETVLAGLDGYALLDTLKREGLGRIPFVFVSSRTDALSANKGLLLGAADFLTKPVNPEVLLTKLHKLLGRALSASDVSARISLSDVDRAGSEAYPMVEYDDLKAGVTIMGRFRIEADLGEGGMGKVFKARDERLEEDVVIKVMKDTLTGDSKILEHFKREIRLARKISHPAVVRTFDFWEAGSVKFVTMEFLEGTDLRHQLKERGSFPVPVACRLVGELLDGLSAAHELGVVHRDIKPQNIFMPKGGRLRILDFGIAQGLDPLSPDGRTITKTPIGTPEYMSPEQLLGERLDARTDLYSSGIVFHELLTGKIPFAGPDRMETATQRLRADAPPPSTLNPTLPTNLDRFVCKLLSRSREQRPASAREAIDELRTLGLA